MAKKREKVRPLSSQLHGDWREVFGRSGIHNATHCAISSVEQVVKFLLQ